MLKKVLTLLMIILILVGITFGIYFAKNDDNIEYSVLKSNVGGILESVQNKNVTVTKIFTYGRALNFTGVISGINKDNFENAKMYITDGKNFEESFLLNTKFSNDDLLIDSSSEINSGLILDNLKCGKYVVLLRLKLNNSINPKYFSLINSEECKDIEYYSITENGENKRITIKFKDEVVGDKTTKFLEINVEKNELPSEVYDIAIDAGHGGSDKGEKNEILVESDLTLEYSKILKEKLSERGLKVKLIRTEENNNTFTDKNMYDENGRISIACKSKAKLMISLHVNKGNSNGVEIYCPCKSNMNFAQNLANKIVEATGISYSNNNLYKKYDGVYMQNFTPNVITEFTKNAEKNGYAPYNITTDTPYLYTIREVGGIATNAYADGRNPKYSANRYYKSIQGIECYQIELGYINNDGSLLINKKEEYTTSIADAIQDNYLK